jgi:nucleotide-binding universal stress UspA family protein
MFNRILVPLDGSKLAERAIPHAEQFARIFGASITLLQVLEPLCNPENQNPVDPLNWQIRKAEADIYLKGVAALVQENLGGNALEASENPRVEYTIQEGKPAETIVDFAHAENIDLLVISTHGSGGLSRWNISSIIQKVINLIYLPVLIIRAFNSPGVADPEIHYHRILLPIDSSRRSECSLAAGIALVQGEEQLNLIPAAGQSHLSSAAIEAPASKASLLLAAIIKPLEIPIPEPYPVEIGQLSDQLMEVSREAVRDYLNHMNERLPVNSKTCIVENASVSSAIHQLVEQEDADLVVLCAHGYSGQFTWPYGSITRNYIEHGTRPILVIQDVHRSQLRPGAAEIAAEKTGRR